MARVSIIVRTGIIMDIVTVTTEMAMDTVIAIAIAIAVVMGMVTTTDTVDTTAVTRDITVMGGARGEVDDRGHALCGGYRSFFRSTG